MSIREYWRLVQHDWYRYYGRLSLGTYLKALFLVPGCKYTFWMRTCAFSASRPIARYVLFPFARLILQHYIFKYGFHISHRTRIGGGLHLGHTGGVVVASMAVIGRNCNLSHDVTIGSTQRGERQGAPVIGDNVYIGPGAKIIGRVTVGNHVAIGANCVVTKDVPDHAVVVGIPGRVISDRGSDGYISHHDFPRGRAAKT